MTTPHQDGLPALPEMRDLGDSGASNYGYSADDMRDYALAALRSAAPSAQPVQQAATLQELDLCGTCDGRGCPVCNPEPEPVQQAGELTDEQIAAAVVRGWCHPDNSSKDMDPDLNAAIVAEVRAILAAARADAQPVVPADCDVRKIMIDVVPGIDGEGEEVFAKSNADVEELLTAMGEKLETALAPQPVEKQAVPLTREQIIPLWRDRSDGPSNGEIAGFARAIEQTCADAWGIKLVTPPADEGEKL